MFRTSAITPRPSDNVVGLGGACPSRLKRVTRPYGASSPNSHDAMPAEDAAQLKNDQLSRANAAPAFGRYRRVLGVHEGVDGARHSRVDFHSWRRWFITAARNAGMPIERRQE